MTGQEFMRQIKKIRRKIRLLSEQIERDTVLASGVGTIRYDKVSVQTSPIQDRMTDIVANIIQSTDEYEYQIKLLQKQEAQARSLLIQLTECHERVLSLHYLDGLSWSQVAVKLNYDDGYIYEVKDKALNELTKVLNKTEQN